MARTAVFGCCFTGDDDKNGMVRSRLIDRQLTKDKDKMKRTQKILLLGSGESGKSTFLKQMRIINGKVFESDELKVFKLIIYGNIIKGMKVLIDARDKLQLPFELPASVQRANFVFSYDNNIKLEEPVFLQYVPAMLELWKDRGVQMAFDRRREFQLGESIKYYLDNLDRIGQMRSQRQKWYQCFDEVTSILFLVSSSEFDQVLYEDRKTNRLVESCDIFEAIVNNKAFTNVSVILFLNKTDLLEQKIKDVSISDYFCHFRGNPQNLSDVQEFELDLLNQRRRDHSRPLFSHFTTAIDTQNIKFVFQAVKETILRKNLNLIMME